MPQGAMDGGVAMPSDGRYIARSQGRRCEYVQGWTDRFLLLQNLHFRRPWRSSIARSHGRWCGYAQGRAVCHKEPWMAMSTDVRQVAKNNG